MLNKLNTKKFLSNSVLHLKENKKNKQKLIYILCGYKKYLYEKVFTRFIKYMDIDADVCLVSSGKFDNELYELARKNGWCYLSTTKNNISIAQNIVISLYKNAKTIIKMDEDIFVTKGTFSNLIKIQNILENKGKKYSLISPILNVNCATSVNYLDLLHKKDLAESKFGKFVYCRWNNGWDVSLPEINPNYVKFLWNNTGELFTIDDANEVLKQLNVNDYFVCKHYFSIGLILFTRKFWKKMGLFNVHKNKLDLAIDERQFNRWGKYTKYKMYIAQKNVCGHFSYTPTNNEMKDFFLSHKNAF